MPSTLIGVGFLFIENEKQIQNIWGQIKDGQKTR
jgi:hypothetical protein